MQSDIVLAKLDTARTALAEAKTIQETKKILDVAAAAEIYAKRQQLGEEAVLYATSIKVEALRQLGNMLKETPRNIGAAAGGKKDAPRGTYLELRDNIATLADMGLDKKTSKLAQDVAELSEEKLEAVKSGIVSISKAILSPHVSYNSGENEWYTPPEYIAAAIRVMGRIDLDPASSEMANKTVGATMFYTKENSGLDKFWAGRVWMNPPYSSNLIGRFIEKYVDHVEAGDISDGIVLVNNATETNWFSDLVSVSAIVLFTQKRIRFLDQAGSPTGAPLQGQAILYAGKNTDGFINAFGEFGWIAKIVVA